MTGRAWAAVVLLAVDGLIAGAHFFARLRETQLIRDVAAGRLVHMEELLDSDATIESLVRLHLFAFVLAAAFFLGWLYSATKRAQAISAAPMAFTPRAAVLWWFVPLANLIQGYRTVDAVWKASDPTSQPGDPRYGQAPSGTWLLGAWWLTYLGGNIASRALPSTLRGDETLDQLIQISQGAAVIWAVVAIAAVLAILVVRSIERRLAASEANAAARSLTLSAPEINPGFPPPPA